MWSESTPSLCLVQSKSQQHMSLTLYVFSELGLEMAAVWVG